MKLSNSNLAIAGLLAVAALGAAFWMLALSPKREEAKDLETEVTQLKSTLAQHEAEIVAAEEARESFPLDYQKLVVLGKAVPGDDDVASLLVQLNRIADRSGVRFNDLQQEAGGEETTSETTAPEGATPTEAAAALLPLGATIGPAGLGVMPYTLAFEGSFFQIADFIKGLDSLVETQSEQVRVDGRLTTIDDFTLEASEDERLTATFSVTTYLTPPGEGPAVASEAAVPATAAPVATTTGGVAR